MDKILILSDLFIGSAAGDEDRVLKVLAHAMARHGDAKAIVLAGTLAQSRRSAQYQVLERALSRLALPVLVVPAPDDSRTKLVSTFPGLKRMPGGHMQSVTDLHRHRLITLDTRASLPAPARKRDGAKGPGEASKGSRSARVSSVSADPHIGAPDAAALRPGAGDLCPDRLAWLMRALDGAEDRNRIVLMHHGPIKTGMPSADALRLQNGRDVLDLLASYPQTQVIFALPRRAAGGLSRGVTWQSLASLARPAALDLDGEDPHQSRQWPSYAILLLQKRGAVLHHQELTC